MEPQAKQLWKEHLASEAKSQFHEQEKKYLQQTREYIKLIDDMRSEQNKDWIKMFETWTEQLKFTAEIQSYSRLPTLHLDHDVAKDPKFTHKLKIQMRQQMNDLFAY